MKNRISSTNSLLKTIFIPIGLSIASFFLRLIALKQTTYANGWDGYYYIMQAFTFIERGKMRALDFSPVYILVTGIAYFIKDYILALKLSSALLVGALTFAGIRFVHRITDDFFAAMLAGAFFIFSPTLTFVSAQFPKNMLGMIFLILFLTALTTPNSLTKGLTFILTFVSHRLTAGLASIVLLIEVINQRKVRIVVLVLGCAVILGLMFLPGIIHIADVQRLSGSISIMPNFAPLSFVKISGFKNISITWYIEIAIMYCAFIYFIYINVAKIIKKVSIPKVHLFICIILLMLGFPFFAFSSGSMGYRLYLMFNVMLIPVIGLISVLCSQRVKVALSVMLFTGGLFSYRSYNPKIFDPPYNLYFSMISPIENIYYQHNAELVVAHQGLAQLLIIYTDLNVTNWQPSAGIDKTRTWRVTVNLGRDDFAEYLPDDDLQYVRVLSNDYHYYLIRDDKWEKFYEIAQNDHNNDILLRIEYWGNPISEKPLYLTQGRNLFQKKDSAIPSASCNDEKYKKIQKFIKAYPEFLDTIYVVNTVIWKDGTRMVFDDGIEDKDFNTLLDSPDLEDQLSMNYPKGAYFPLPALNHDPGRIRYEPFFKKMYGITPEAVEAKLVPIVWLPSTEHRILYITSVNKINEKLQAISYELDSLPAEMKKYVVNPGGTYQWRKISGTNRLSMHSFGIAIDINAEHANYWIWDAAEPEAEYHYQNVIPKEIIEIFEKYGFIWGGKWYHYDTMHFEYRPELLLEDR